MRLVLASNNAGKLAEFNRLLGDAGLEFIAQGELGDGGGRGLEVVERGVSHAPSLGRRRRPVRVPARLPHGLRNIGGAPRPRPPGREY